ncbi:hypothetical protein [Azospirillum halopraeferens]|uniref:hypothetical protein n=1 Tax=Azospirillum halopraeferens TaxID=34010 RepID=UPI00040FA4EF|nr:hypothetical protein [Azospirillum halopraeferens]
MTADELTVRGAFALYRAENPHRIAELQKGSDAEAAIAADFETYRNRYVRKFADVRSSLEAEGLFVTRAA